MRLFFLRHGLADRAAWHGESDDERPLTPYGRQRMTKQADTLRQLNLGLELILTSPLIRARQTAEIVAEALDLLEQLQTDPRLGFGFGPRVLGAMLDELSVFERILLVGHEPSFSETISTISGGSEIVCKKGSLARVDLFQTSPPVGELIWLIPPKVLAL